MDHKATVDTARRPARDLRRHLSGTARDAARIVDLQLQLLAADLRESRAGIARGACCWLASIILAAALLPAAIAGVGVLLAEHTRLTLAGGILLSAAAAALIAAVLAFLGRSEFVRQRQRWQRSIRDFQDNLQSLRRAFVDEADRDTEES